MEADVWSELEVSEREKISNLIMEFCTTVVSWNNQEQEKVVNSYSQLIQACQDQHMLKPHQLAVISKMLQETAISSLYEWLPEDYEAWSDKDELMAMFFFGEKGLESYREKKEKVEKN